MSDDRQSEPEMRTFSSSTSVPQPVGRAILQEVELLEHQDRIAASLRPTELSAYIKAVVAAIDAAVAECTETFELLAQIQLAAGQPAAIELRSQGQVAPVVLQRISDVLGAVQVPLVADAPVPFRLRVRVNG